MGLPHAPTSPGACARGRAGVAGRDASGLQIGNAEPRAGADAGGAEARAEAGGAHFGMGRFAAGKSEIR